MISYNFEMWIGKMPIAGDNLPTVLFHAGSLVAAVLSGKQAGTPRCRGSRVGRGISRRAGGTPAITVQPSNLRQRLISAAMFPGDGAPIAFRSASER